MEEERAEIEKEFDALRRQQEWYRRLHGHGLPGLISGRRPDSFARAATAPRDLASRVDIAAPPSRRGFELTGETGKDARLRRRPNPHPRSSLGFAALPVEVIEDAARRMMLKIAFDERLSSNVNLATIRMFRFDDITGGWQILLDSGSSARGRFSWARITRAGLYAPVGLPLDPWLVYLVWLLDSHAPWLQAGREIGEQARVLDAICSLVFDERLLESLQRNTHLSERVHLPPVQTRGRMGAIRETIRMLEVPAGGLPEASLLHDLPDVPPWWPLPLPHLPKPDRPIPWPLLRTWTSAGPTNISGRILSLAIHPGNGDVLYAGAANGGVWRTLDGGESWTLLLDTAGSLAIGALGISRSNANVLYAGTGEIFAYGRQLDSPGVGVYKTSDGGTTWIHMPGVDSTACTQVQVHPTNPNIVYVAGNQGLHKSTDGGGAWTKVRYGAISDVRLDMTTPDTIYAASLNLGVEKSTDGGATWEWLGNRGLPFGASAGWIRLNSAYQTLGLPRGRGPAKRRRQRIKKLLLAKAGVGVYKSTDGGAIWTLVPNFVDPSPPVPAFNMVAVDPNDWDVIFAGGVILNQTRDGGQHWVGGDGRTHPDNHALVFSPTDPTVCYVATDGGVFRSAVGGAYGSWEPASTGLVTTQFYGVGVSQTSPLVLGAATQDVGFLTSAGKRDDWFDTNGGPEGGLFVIDPSNSSNMYITPMFRLVRRSTDGGKTWQDIRNGLPPLPSSWVLDPWWPFLHIAVDPGNSNHLLYAQGTQVFESHDQGLTWHLVFDTGNDALFRLAFSPSNPQECYVASLQSGRLYRSTGSGNMGTWAEPYAEADRPPPGRITALAVGWSGKLAVGGSSLTVVYVYSGYAIGSVYKSTDGGAHWTDAGGSSPGTRLPDTQVNALVVDPGDDAVVYAGTDIGVFRTLDGGDSWESFSDGLPPIMITDLAVRRISRMLYAGTLGRGIFKISLR